MKSITDTRHAATTNIEDRHAFTIQATGKAFRTLIDGIYSNKILAPVRELMTNAFDGHLARGNVDVPFQVTVPSIERPVFAVRDFGVGMDHDTVVTRYTSLFDSSKDDTNDQVGMLGLGSKSPFAYTDTFTVTCFDGVEKRVYNAHMDDDIPQLGLVYREASDEEQGVEVQFPVESRDFQVFGNAIQRVLLGFDVAPTLIDPTNRVQPRTLLHDGGTYKLYRTLPSYEEYLSAVNVRMGCVVYPVSTLRSTEFSRTSMPANVRFVIDVPIGTSNITTNREALSDDVKSVTNLTPYLDAAYTTHKDSILSSYANATSRLEKMKMLHEVDYEWRRAFNLPLNLTVSMMNDGWDSTTIAHTLEIRRPGFFVLDAKKKTNVKYEFTYERLGQYRFILDEEGVVRKTMRIREAMKTTRAYEDGFTYVVPVAGQAAAVARLKRLCGMQDSQFVKVSDLDDPGPVSKGGSTTRAVGSQASKKGLKAALASGMPWVRKMRGKVDTKWTGYSPNHNWADQFILSALGVDAVLRESVTMENSVEVWDTNVVLPLSDAQITALSPDPNMEVSQVLRRAYDESGVDERVRTIVFAHQLRQDLNHEHLIDVRGDLARTILEVEGIDFTTTLSPADSQAMYGRWGVNSINHLLLSSNSYYRKNPTTAQAHFAPSEEEIGEAIEALRRKYPALFAMDEHDIAKYIEEVNAAS